MGEEREEEGKRGEREGGQAGEGLTAASAYPICNFLSI